MNRLLIGTISDNQKQIQSFLNSLNSLIFKFPNEFSKILVFVLENGVVLNLDKNISNFKLIKIEQKNRESISKNRTTLQTTIYKFAQKNDIFWIIDDDLSFDYYGKKLNYFEKIKNLQNKNIHAILGLVSETPPLPFLSTLTTQLSDILFNLQNIKNSNFISFEEKKLHNSEIIKKYRDYYYDFSEFNNQNINFYCLDKNQNISLFEQKIENLTNGQTVCRQISFDINQFGNILNDSIFRGGNTIIFNKKMLLVENYSFSPNKYNRRSDFNWAIINTKILNLKIKEAILPLRHQRTNSNLKFTEDLEKIKSDIEGLIFYRIFEKIIQNQTFQVIFNYFLELKNQIFKNILNNHQKAIQILIKLEIELENNQNIQILKNRIEQEIKNINLLFNQINFTENDFYKIKQDISQIKEKIDA